MKMHAAPSIKWLALGSLVAAFLMTATPGVLPHVGAPAAKAFAARIAAPAATTTVEDWGWENPLPQGDNLDGVSCPTPTLCKAVAGPGTILSWNGTSWGADSSATTSPLLAVSCPTATLCKAVGSAGSIVSWDGTSWSAESASTFSGLNGVSCPTATLCKAVGSGGTIVSWNGTSWSADSSGTSSTLQDVSCATATLCKAVSLGGAILSWNGSNWSIDSSDSGSFLTGVSCPTASLCKAVGFSGAILSWNGTVWSADSSGTANDLYGVSCLTGTLCKAVGDSGTIVSWEGTSWSADSSGTTPILRGVSCGTQTLCKAVGDFGTIVSWNAVSWSADSFGTAGDFYGVSCSTTTQCKAVGQSGTIASWNGTSWIVEYAGTSRALRAVSCPTATFCKAVGDFGTILSWDGTGWSFENSGTTQNLLGVSCPTATLCKVVGALGRIVSWSGGTIWSAEPSDTSVALYGVSCATATLCKAAGDFGTIVSWNGASWFRESSATTILLRGVSCPTTTLCKAVGDFGTIVSWNGTSWSADTSGTPASLFGVSCPTATVCRAVQIASRVVSWDGTSWSESPVPTTQLDGISCSTATLCKAVGATGKIVGLVPQTLTDVFPGFAIDLFQTGCLDGLAITQTRSNHPNATPSLQTGVYWSVSVSPAGCSSGYSAFITLPTSFTPDADSRVCRYTGGGTTWDCAQNGFTASPPRISRWAITQFSDWAAARGEPPTAVRLTRLAARARPDGIAVSWKTLSELELAGFRLYRAHRPAGPWMRLNENLIQSAAPGRSTGSGYLWVDRTAKPRKAYLYRLSVVDRAGVETPLATVRARMSAENVRLAGSAASARAGSILYLKGGKLWVASPDGSVMRRVPHAGSFDNPSQADNGTIVVQRGIYFHRLDRRGKSLNEPITTAFRTNPLLPAFKGPFWPEVSPDGTKIAYTYSFTAAHYDPTCDCQRVSPSLNTSYTYSNRFVEAPDKLFGSARFYWSASWIDNRSVLATTEHLYNYAGNVLNSVAVDALGGGLDSYRSWFSECVEGCDDVQTLKMYRVNEGEMTRRRDKLVFTAGDLDGPASGTRMFIYAMKSAPPALPGNPCHVTGPNGKFTSPSWSPDGKSLAWADRKGIWVGRVSDISGQTCGLTRKLLIPGGSQPDWGPARP